MPIIKRMKGLPQELLATNGLLYQDWFAINRCQRECAARLATLIQREQEQYMSRHPEILALLKIFIAKMTQRSKRKDFGKEAAYHFTRSFAELDEEIRIFLQSPPDGPYIDMRQRLSHDFVDTEFLTDLKDIITKHYPPEQWYVPSPPASTINTESSSFVSILTSENTLPTPEPIPTPELTTSEIFYKMVSNAVDKVIYVQVDDAALLYDTAYVELMKVVERAMEVPVIDIKADIAKLFRNAYRYFELNIAEKERIAAAEAWEKRMRKKLKRSLRQKKNFRGYETPPSPQSDDTSHESYKSPPPRPCKCQPLAQYNRYGKDRFGIYLPRGEVFDQTNITTTPAVSTENLSELDDRTDTRSLSRTMSTPPRTQSFGSRSTTSRRTGSFKC